MSFWNGLPFEDFLIPKNLLRDLLYVQFCVASSTQKLPEIEFIEFVISRLSANQSCRPSSKIIPQ